MNNLIVVKFRNIEVNQFMRIQEYFNFQILLKKNKSKIIKIFFPLFSLNTVF